MWASRCPRADGGTGGEVTQPAAAVLVRGRGGLVAAVAMLTLGAVALVVLLLALLDMARTEDLQTGAVFAQAATNLRWTVLGEAVFVLLSAAAVAWRVHQRTILAQVLAGTVWILVLFDLWIVGSAGAIPR